MSGHSPHAPTRTHCLNCGTALIGPYCSTCGQHAVDYHRSLGHVVEDSLEGLLHYDGRFIVTVRYLFTRPGFLTREFNAGRRVRYTHPLRFYVFASFLVFLLSSFLPNHGVHIAVPNAAEHGKPLVSAATLTSPEFSQELLHILPEAMFVCVPVLALFLSFVFRHPRRYYVEHFIFALHIQALYFLGALLSMLAGLALGRWSHAAGANLQSLISLGILYLIYRAMLAVYGENRWKTFLKFIGVGFAYILVLALALIAAVLIAVALVGHPA